MTKSLFVLSLTLAATAAAHAQNVRTPVAPTSVAAPAQADMMKMQMAMMDAQQKAIKPGDEALPCEALQRELLATMNDPSIQAYASKTNAAYAKELEAQKKAPLTANAAATLAAALASSAAPTGPAGMPALAPGQTMTPQQMQQMMAAQQQASIAYMNQLAPIMPALMRSQRV